MFLERLISNGMQNSKYWYDITWNWFAKDGLWLPNCTCYACGRSSEAAGRNVKQQIPRTNAQTWYEKSNWRGSATPKVGAIAVWGGGKYGHVGIVERVNSNGSVVISQSNYNRGTTVQRQKNYFVLGTYVCEVGKVTIGIGWTFLGYLINPYINDKRVARDENKHQIEVFEEKVRARKAPNGQVYSGLFIPQGIYDILDTDGDWVKVDDEVWFSKGEWAKEYEPKVDVNLVKIIKDPEYDWRWSVDGNRYGDKYDVTTMHYFEDQNLKDQGWEKVLEVNGSFFYTYDNQHFAEGLELSRGVNNQEVEMSCVTDYNEAMAIGMDYIGGMAFEKQKDIIAMLDSYYSAITGIGIMKNGEKVDWGIKEHQSQWDDISGRTIIGTDKEGNYLSYSLAGVTGKSGLRGSEFYDLCKGLGFWNAICFDGGGSVFRILYGEDNITSTRKVKNALLLYRKKKEVAETPENPPISDEVDMLNKHIAELEKSLESLKNELKTKDNEIAELKKNHEREIEAYKEKFKGISDYAKLIVDLTE